MRGNLKKRPDPREEKPGDPPNLAKPTLKQIKKGIQPKPQQAAPKDQGKKPSKMSIEKVKGQEKAQKDELKGKGEERKTGTDKNQKSRQAEKKKEDQESHVADGDLIKEEEEKGAEGPQVMQIEASSGVKFQEVPGSNISPNALHPRFQIFGSATLRIYGSKTYEAIKKAIDKHITQSIYGERLFFIHGPVGVGKSFALALYVLKQKYNTEWTSKNMIYYINNPHIFDHEYFFNELRETIQFAQLTGDQRTKFKQAILVTFEKILKQFKLMPKNTAKMQLEGVINLMLSITTKASVDLYARVLYSLVDVVPKTLFVFIDQALTGYPPPENNNVPIPFFQEFISYLIEKSGSRSHVIFCSSRQIPSEWKNFFKMNVNTCKVGERFTDEETIFFLDEHFDLGKFKIEAIEQDKELLETIKRETKCIPYELAQICRISKECQEEDREGLIIHYYRDRSLEIKTIHQSYLNQVSETNKKLFIECLAYSRLGLQITSSNECCLDQNLCYFEEGTTYPKTLKFYHPLFQNYMENEYDFEIKKLIAEILKNQSLKDKLSGLKFKKNTLEDLTEKFALSQLEFLSQNPGEQIWNFYYYKKTGEMSTLSTQFKICHSQRFKMEQQHQIGEEIEKYVNEGQVDPNAEFGDYYSGVLYIPGAENCQLVDAFFVDKNKKIVFLIQITINISTHDSTGGGKTQKSDARFYELLPHPELIHQRSLRSVVQTLTRRQDIQFRWLWLGLLDGSFRVNHEKTVSMIKDKLQGLHKESWIILMDHQSQPLFHDLKLYFDRAY